MSLHTSLSSIRSKANCEFVGLKIWYIMVCSFALDALVMNWPELELIFEYRSSLFLCTDVNVLILTAASIVSSAPGHLCTQNRETESVKTSGACALILLVLLLTT